MNEETMIELTKDAVQTVAEHKEAFYQSAEFWVGAVFVVVVGLLVPPAIKLIKKLTNDRISRIKEELHEAENLKLDAQKLYAEYEKKFINAEKEAEDIIDNQQRFIEQTKEKKISELNQFLNRKQTETTARIDLATEQLKKTINTKICYNAFEIVYQVMGEKLIRKDHDRLINESIDNIKNLKIGG